MFARLRADASLRVSDVRDVAIRNEYGQTLLQEAIAHRPDVAIPLIERGLDVADHDGRTALYFAASHALHDVAVRLIEGGCDLDATDRHGNNPLWTAVLKPKPDYQASSS